MGQDNQQVSFKRRWQETQPTKTILFWSMVAAMILTMIVGFNWGGWVTGNTAQKMAETAATEAVVDRLALICVDQFNQDPEKVQKFQELNEAKSYQRDEYVRDQGWATMFGDEKPDRNVANVCADLIAQIDQE